MRTELVDKLIHNMEGTKLDLIKESVKLGIDPLTREELAYFNSKLFRCDECGKWLPQAARIKEYDILKICEECYDIIMEGWE